MNEENDMNSNESSTSNLLLAFLGGAIVGAGVALLYAPQSGRRTRQKLRDFSEDAEEYAREMLTKAEKGMEKAEERGEEWAQKGEDFIEEKKRQMKAAMDHGKAVR